MRVVGQPVAPVGTKWAKILVPIDFSQPSLDALRYAKALAMENGARLVVLHVVAPLHEAWKMDTAKLERLLRVEARRRLNDLQKTELPAPARATFFLRCGHPAEEINHLAALSRADLIVIATHGRSGLSHVLLGSVAERVVRHAPCPVLVLRSKRERQRRNARDAHSFPVRQPYSAVPS